MPEEESPSTVITDQYAAIESGDMEALRRVLSPNLRVWHNDDEYEKNIDEVITDLTNLVSISTSREYRDRRITTVGDVAFLQHTLTAELRSGAHFRLPAMMRVEISLDGLIERIDEYYDSAALGVLADAAASEPFTAKEAEFLASQSLARIATATPDAKPHVVPVILQFDAVSQTIAIALHDLPAPIGQNRRYRRNLEHNPYIAIVVDDFAGTEPWTPLGIEVRGRVEIKLDGGERFGTGAGPVWIDVIPTWVSSWGIETPSVGAPFSRAVSVRHVSNGAESG